MIHPLYCMFVEILAEAYKVCKRAKWPIRPELISVSVAWSDQEYFYSPLDGMLVHRRATPSIKFADTHLSTPGWRETLWEFSTLPNNTTQCLRSGLGQGSLDPEPSALNIVPSKRTKVHIKVWHSPTGRIPFRLLLVSVSFHANLQIKDCLDDKSRNETPSHENTRCKIKYIYPLQWGSLTMAENNKFKNVRSDSLEKNFKNLLCSKVYKYR